MASHKVYPHGVPEVLSDGVWRVRGLLPIPLHRNMIVVRLPGDDLLLHSVVALDEAGLRSLEALGRPRHAIVPSHMHQMDAAFYKARYPDLIFLAPTAARPSIHPSGIVSGTVEEALPSLGFTLHAVPGTKAAEYVYEFPLASGGRALIVNDVFGGPEAHDATRLLGRLVVRHLAVPGNRFGIARIYRWRMITDVEAVRRFAAELAEIPDVRLITLSHGEAVRDAPAEALRSVAAA